MALAAVASGLAMLAAPAHAQVPSPAPIPCDPVPVPGCTPPPPPPPSSPPPSGSGGGSTGQPPSQPPPPQPRPPRPCPLHVSPAGRSSFIGVVADDVIQNDARYRRCNLSTMARSGVAIIRQVFHWESMERSPGRYDFSFYDEYVRTLARHRIKVLPILIAPPSFRKARPRSGARAVDACPPRRSSDFAAFAARLVRRYGPRGTIWRRGAPRVPITSWQVWNEPNLPAFWCTGVSARAYTSMLKVVYRAIKRADRRAEVVTAGIPAADPRRIRGSVRAEQFIAQMYRSGAASGFDTLAINTFGRSVSGVLAEVRQVRRLMSRHRDGRAPLWLTEIGWATGGPRSPSRVSTGEQARRINGALKSLTRNRRRLRIRGVVYYNWRDTGLCSGCRDYSGLHTGLLTRDGRPKAGYRAFRDTARRIR